MTYTYTMAFTFKHDTLRKDTVHRDVMQQMLHDVIGSSAKLSHPYYVQGSSTYLYEHKKVFLAVYFLPDAIRVIWGEDDDEFQTWLEYDNFGFYRLARLASCFVHYNEVTL